jgi:hypothetical protein
MAYRDPANTNERGAYVPHHWWFNKNNCYITSFSEAGVGGECSTGWWKTDTYDSMTRAKTSWVYWEAWRGLDPAGSSGRGQMYVCHDYAWASDPCSGSYYLRGADY